MRIQVIFRYMQKIVKWMFHEQKNKYMGHRGFEPRISGFYYTWT